MKELTTDSVSKRDRLAYWTDIACNIYVQLDCHAPSAEDFSARLHYDRLALIDVTEIACTPHKVMRTPRQIAKATEDCFLVSWQRRGSSSIRQDSREALLQEGDFCLYDSTRPYELKFDGCFEQLILRFPRDLLRERLATTENLTATTVSGTTGIGALTSMLLKSLAEKMSVQDGLASIMLSNAVLDMVAAGFSSLPMAGVASENAIATLRKQQIRNYILAHLSDPGLAISGIAAAVGLSESSIHQLFRGEAMSVGRLIWTGRLDRCRDALRNPALFHKTVSEIAFSWGFNDAAHFSRAFKERFGISPREFRHGAD